VAQEVGIRELLEAGVHFGHQTRRWNPKMRRFIYGERGGIYIIDLLRTEALLGQAQRFADGLSRRGGTVLFVGTKKQARDGIKEIAEAAGQPYVNHRWLGGLLTNFQTISARIKRLHDLERYETEGQLELLPTRERMAAQADLEKLRANLGGVKNMQRVPDALFVIDLKTEAIAVREAQRLRIPIIGLVDTNCDPDGIDYVIPGNDDGIRACNIVTKAIGDVIAAGNRSFRAEEERARQEAAEQARREAEEKARKEAEEQARREAEEAAAREALTQGGASEAVTSPERGGDEAAGPGDGEAVEPRDAAEATVAQAVADLGRPQAEGRRAAEAGAAAQAADEPAMPKGGESGTVRRERVNPNAGESVPQEAGAPAGAGAPASEAAAAAAAASPPKRARSRARKAKEPEAAAVEPGPSAAAEEAMTEATPAEAPGEAAPRPERTGGEAAASDTPADASPAEPEAEAVADLAEGPPADSEATPAAESRPARKAPRSAGSKAAAPVEPDPDAAAEASPAQAADTAAASETDDKSAVDRAQAAANTVVDTAQDVAAGAAGVAETAAEAVADRAPGPLGAVAGAAAGAVGAVKGAVENTETDEDEEKDSK
jgi:small subunit ribosomal protein S2